MVKMSRLSPAKTKSSNRRSDREKQSRSRQPASDFYAGIQTLQRNAGNRAVTGWLQPRMDLNSNVMVSEPDDASELQADRIADQVISSPSKPQVKLDPNLYSVPPAASGIGLGPGEPLDAETRNPFESHFGVDFSPVRVHAGPEAHRAARGFGASAFTVGSNIAFAAGQFAPQSGSGRRLLAHELTHVAQPHSATVARTVSPDYDKIKDKLTYKLTDWAITDKEAHDVLEILSKLAGPDFDDTLQAMEKDGLVSALLENISDKDQTAYAPLIQKIHSQRGALDIGRHIKALMSYEPILDWVITDSEARLVLDALKSLKGDPKKLRDVVIAIPAKQYERFFGNLSGEDRSANLRFLQDIEMMRSSGMTLDEMAGDQKKYLEAQATAEGKTVGEYIGGEVAKRGYGGNTPVWWSSLTKTQQDEREKKFAEVMEQIKKRAPKEIREIISSAEAAGGGIVFDPDKAEEMGAYGVRRGDKLIVGKSWLETAETDIKDVYDNISHELGGHREYGDKPSWEIMEGTLKALPPAERAKATGGVKSPYSAYGYMETEIYAELRELPYTTERSGSDNPADDVEEQLTKIKEAFSPTVAEALVRGFRRRIQLDSKITGKARDIYDEKVKAVFAIEF